MWGFILKVLGSHRRLWSQRRRGISLDAENENRPCLSQSLSFPALGRIPQIHNTEAAPPWKPGPLALPLL